MFLAFFLVSQPEGRSEPFEKEKLDIKNSVQCTFPDECSGQHYLMLKSKLWGFVGISKAAVIPQPLCITSCLTQGFYSPWNSLSLFNQFCSRRKVGEGIICSNRISGDQWTQAQLSRIETCIVVMAVVNIPEEMDKKSWLYEGGKTRIPSSWKNIREAVW